MIVFVWAQAENGVIGLDGKMPWHLLNDLKHFKNVTLNQTVVMGRKTYQDLPIKPFPERENIILTRQEDYQLDDDVLVMNSKDQVLAYGKQQGKDLYVVGGGQIYELFKDDVDVLYQTVIHETIEGDTKFPEIDWSDFKQLESEYVDKSEGHPYSHTFYKYQRQ